MSLEDNKATIRAYVEAVWNQQQLVRADNFMTPDFLDHASLPGQEPGLAGAKKKWAMYQAGIPDLHVTIEDLVAEGDKVGVRRTYEGTHKGELLGVPPTGNHIQFAGISIFRLTRGKIAESWEQVDRLALMQQVGALPRPRQGTS